MQTVTLGSLREKLQKLSLSVIQDLAADIILADTRIISRKIDEFTAGVNPDGSKIGEYKSEPYRLFKIEKNPFAKGKVDLILTGAMKQGLRVEHIRDNLYVIKSTDSKWEALKKKYNDQGGKIHLINQEFWENLQKTYYAPQLNKAMRRLSGL